MAKYLDEAGLTLLWDKIKSRFSAISSINFRGVVAQYGNRDGWGSKNTQDSSVQLRADWFLGTYNNASMDYPQLQSTPNIPQKGDTYRAVTEITGRFKAGGSDFVTIKPGDLLIYNGPETLPNDGGTTFFSSWSIIHESENGYVTGPAQTNKGDIAVFIDFYGNMVTGVSKKDAHYDPNDEVSVNTSITDTSASLNANLKFIHEITTDSNGHIKGASGVTINREQLHYTPVTGNTLSATSVQQTANDYSALVDLNIDSKGHITSGYKKAIPIFGAEISGISNGHVGLVPAIEVNESRPKKYLRGDGSWSTLPYAIAGTPGVVQPGTGLTVSNNGILGMKMTTTARQRASANSVTNTAGRTYVVQIQGNSNGEEISSPDFVVNVPWEQYTLPNASSATKGGIKLGQGLVSLESDGTVGVNVYTATTGPNVTSVTNTVSRYYAVQLSQEGKLIVNVPWTDNNTTYSNATSSTSGLMSNTDKTKLDGIQTLSTADINTICV